MDISTIIAILSLIVAAIGVVVTWHSMVIKVKGKMEVERNVFNDIVFKRCLLVFFIIIAIIALVFISFDSVFNSENFSANGASSSIGDYLSQGNTINQQGDNPILIQGDGTIYYGQSTSRDTIEKQEQKIIMSEDSYKDYLQEIVDEDILFFDYNDYDGDGDCEMFALVGYSDSDYEYPTSNYHGKIWYVNCDGAKEIESRETLYMSTPNVFLFGNCSFVSFEEFYGTSGTKTHIWGVQNGEPYQPNISGKIRGLSFNEFNEIEGIDDEFDAFKCGDEPMMGHTWKPYYFYFDGKTFREYGGLAIEEKDLLKIDGTSEMLEQIYNNSYNVDSIFYRENGVININISKEVENEIKFRNINLRCSKEGFTIIPYRNDSYDSGIYKSASVPAIATYPKEFPF